jgi:tetratricopeptide (TPR) repeat protein
VTYTRTKFPVFYDLETRDWKSAAALEPVPGASPEVLTLTYWARIVADGHLREAKQAQSDLVEYQSLIDQIRKSKPYFVDSTGAKIEHDEVIAWAAFAAGEQGRALTHIRSAADLQDKVGQAEVDIPAREMLADILMESNQPKESLSEYQIALRMSPNRFNGLYNAGRAAEAIGDKQQAAKYYSALMKVTAAGQQSTRAEFAHIRTFLAATQVAER